MADPLIRPELFQFFLELRENNNRNWFEQNKSRYLEEVRDPLLQFVREFRFRLKEISREFEADPRPVGGSLFRIYRDMRFAPDGLPYKTAAGIRFPHKMRPDVHSTGYYLHLEPQNCFAGMGLWRPDTKTLLKIRRRVVDEPEAWQGVKGDLEGKGLKIEGESLKRAPRGFDSRHPLVEDLKRKDWIVVREIPQEDTLKEDFIDDFAQICRQGTPFMRYVTEAIGLPF